ncbi:hypothetical protein [Micromonospora chersina]
MALDLFEGRGFNVATLAVAVLALVVGAVAVYFAREALFPPRRRLSIRLLKPARLLGRAGGEVRDLEVSHRGRVLEDPYVVTVIMRNTGRHAIGSSQFDQGRPIQIDLDAPIEALLGPASGQATSSVAVDDRVILFGPDLIRRKQEIQIQVLTSRAPVLSDSAVTEHLVDTSVIVEIGPYEQSTGSLAWRWLVLVAATGALLNAISKLVADVMAN